MSVGVVVPVGVVPVGPTTSKRVEAKPEGGLHVNQLLLADDTALVAESE